MPNRESRPNGSGSGNDAMQVERFNLNYRVLVSIYSLAGNDEDDPPIGAEECPPEQKESYCMNGGKCVYFSSVREFSCR